MYGWLFVSCICLVRTTIDGHGTLAMASVVRVFGGLGRDTCISGLKARPARRLVGYRAPADVSCGPAQGEWEWGLWGDWLGIPDGSIWPVHAGSWCFTGSVETIVPTKRLGGAADVIGQGCRRCALALCDSKALARAATGRPEVTAGSFPDHPITCCPRLPVFSQRPLHPPAPKNSAFSRSDRHFPLPTPLVRPHRLHLTYRSLHHPLTSSRQPLFAVHHPPRLVTTPQHHTTTHQYVHSHQTPQRPDRI